MEEVINMNNSVSVSVLSADMLDLGGEIKKIENAGAEMLHFDVMDGVFVKNITMGIPTLQAVRRATDLKLDVHLMITEPLRYVREFVKAGADIVSFHLEAGSDAAGTIAAIREAGAKAAVAIKPGTPAEAVFPYLESVDMVLVMTVEPGFGGQSFIESTVDKIKAVRAKINELGLSCHVQVDGGINDITAKTVTDAGADVLVSGSYLFKSENMAESVGKLKVAR